MGEKPHTTLFSAPLKPSSLEELDRTFLKGDHTNQDGTLVNPTSPAQSSRALLPPHLAIPHPANSPRQSHSLSIPALDRRKQHPTGNERQREDMFRRRHGSNCWYQG